jgi:hypothetical protein
MFRKAAATLLLILAASPFTAPFATCDVLTLFGKHTTTAQYQRQAPRASTEDHWQALAMASAWRRGRVRHRSPAPASTTPAVERLTTPRSTIVVTVAFATAPTHTLTTRTPLRI